ncbi:hypothetical protein D9M68_552300 [compost metagenome]
MPPAAHRPDHGGAVRRKGQAHARLRALLHGGRRAGLQGHRARRSRLRREVLYRRGQLGSGRQQHAGVLHPGRDEVPGPGARREAGAPSRHAAGRVGARHVLGLRVADAGIHPHAHVAHVGSRHSAQFQNDAGVRRAYVPLRQRRRRIPVGEVPLEPGAGHAFPGVGRGGQGLRGRSRLPSARSLGSHRRGQRPAMGTGRAGLHRGRGGAVQFRRAGRHQDRAGGAGAGGARRQAGAGPQSRQFLRRDGAGRLLCGTCDSRPGFHQRPLAGRAHPFLRGHADIAAGRPEFPRDSDQRAAGFRAEQPARRHASPGHSSRPGGVRTQLVGGRLSVPGRHGRFCVLSGAGRGRRAARTSREIRRTLQPGHAVLCQPDRLGTAPHRQRLRL